jgi:hypothetical protein
MIISVISEINLFLIYSIPYSNNLISIIFEIINSYVLSINCIIKIFKFIDYFIYLGCYTYLFISSINRE